MEDWAILADGTGTAVVLSLAFVALKGYKFLRRGRAAEPYWATAKVLGCP